MQLRDSLWSSTKLGLSWAFVCLLCAALKAPAADLPKTASADAKPPVDSAKKHPAKPHTHTAAKTLVPPPPPDIPLLDGSEAHVLSTLGVPLDYMSKSDLLTMQSRLQDSIPKLEKQVADRDQSLKDKRDRVTQFEDLFKEGVVSRKELEAARREAAEGEEHGNDLALELTDAKLNLERVRKQLVALDKRSTRKNAGAGHGSQSTAKAKAQKLGKAGAKATTVDAGEKPATPTPADTSVKPVSTPATH